MTETTTIDRTPLGARAALRRVATVGAVAALGLLAPAAAAAGGPPPGPGDLTADPGCEPDLPCDVDPDPDPGECPPFVATCDLAPGGDGPDDPGDPCEDAAGEADAGEAEAECPGPGTGEPGEPAGEVDEPVPATPNFTG